MVEQIKGVNHEEALNFHNQGGKPGKLQISATKPLLTQRDLALAYSPGVAVPCLEIEKDPEAAYEYTAKGNFVAVISNGTAVLGLGNLGALASKPVMEGKSVLFKRFADIDSIDLEVDTSDPDKFVDAVKYLGPSWGGINLEDIKAPECFIIEEKLKECMDIPIFHDDQHGTAIITAAGLINAAHLSKRKMKDIKLVVLGAGSAGIACTELVKAMGVPHNQVMLVDRMGVVYEGRKEGMNQWKSAHAVKTKCRTLEDAMKWANAFYGLAGKGAVNKEMVASMEKNPIIFAMANPDPEITPEEVREVRNDAIIATGRSDYPNQVNNVLGFPYIFRGALDVHATTINEEMKIAAATALAELAREPVPDEVASAYGGRKMNFGPDYIIPVPFDPRLISKIPVAVAKAAMKTKVARKPIEDFEKYKHELNARLNPTANSMNLIFERCAENPRTMIFSEGEEETIVSAAFQWKEGGYGDAILVGRREKVQAVIAKLGHTEMDGIKIHNAALTKENDKYIDFLYKKLQRRGYLKRDVIRMVKNDRNIFGACMLACGDGDAMVTGTTRVYSTSLNDIMKVIEPEEGKRVMGTSMVVSKDKRTVFIADTSVDPLPCGKDLADIATQASEMARNFAQTPRVALLSFSNFGSPMHEKTKRMRQAIEELDNRKVDFEYDGEMSVSVALNPEMMKLYPFSRLSGPANVLLMPGLHSANISSRLLQELGGGSVIGPILSGLKKPVQIATMASTVSDILNLAAIAATDSINNDAKKPAKKKAVKPKKAVKSKPAAKKSVKTTKKKTRKRA